MHARVQRGWPAKLSSTGSKTRRRGQAALAAVLVALAATSCGGGTRSPAREPDASESERGAAETSRPPPEPRKEGAWSAERESPASERFAHREAGVALSIPARWAKRSDRDALIVLSDDRDLMMVLLVIDTVDVPRAMEGLVVHLQRYVTEPALSDPRADELNGMRALYVGGTGSLNGNPVTLGVIVTFTPRDKALVVFGIASESTSDDTHQQAETMLASIHPL